MEYIQQIKTEIFNCTNEIRARYGAPLLSYSKPLDRMGQLHTNEMYTHKFFLHNNPFCKKAETLFDRMKYCGLSGIYDMVGENLADYPAIGDTFYLSPLMKICNMFNVNKLMPARTLSRNIINLWYDSHSHRINLLCPDFNYVGFGLLLYPKDCDGVKIKYLLVTQNFGRSR